MFKLYKKIHNLIQPFEILLNFLIFLVIVFPIAYLVERFVEDKFTGGYFVGYFVYPFIEYLIKLRKRVEDE